MIQQPYAGVATIEESFGKTVITIPAKKNARLLFVIPIWLLGWLVGFILALGIVTGKIHVQNQSPDAFMVFWLALWTFGGAYAILLLLWTLGGKEIVSVESGLMTISRTRAPFYKAKTYDLREIKNLRAEIERDDSVAFRRNRRTMPGPYSEIGTLRFDYGMKTVKFGQSLDLPEGNHIIALLRKKNLVS